MLLFIKFNTKIFSFSLILCKKVYLCTIIKFKSTNYDKRRRRKPIEVVKRIAKEERMSPADFVEAEERDDDELINDEWEEDKYK